MATVRFKKDTQHSFFGNFLYAQILPRDHFLVKAKDTIAWGHFTTKLLRYYKGGGEYGRAAYEPAPDHTSLTTFKERIIASVGIKGYEAVGGGGNYQCAYIERCVSCTNCSYGSLLRNCSDCFGCVALTHKQYYILNNQLTKEEYKEALRSIKKELGWNG